MTDKIKEIKILKTINREEQETKKLKKQTNYVKSKIKLIERYIRDTTYNEFEKVYISMAFEKIIDELALQYTIGKVDIVNDNDEISVTITNSKLTSTDIKNVLESEKHVEQIYTLAEALKEIDDFTIETNPEGPGIIFKAKKKLVIE